MGTVLYGGKEIPLFESIATYKDVVYGLAKSDSGRSYYLCEINKAPMKFRMHLNVEEGTLLELGVDKKEDKLGVFCITPDGKDEGFMALPIK